MSKNDQLKDTIRLVAKICDEPQDYIESYVAFLDILAFKSLIIEKSSAEIKNIFNEIRMVNTLLLETGFEGLFPQEVKENLKVTFLSDSIIISISKNIEQAFFGLFVYCMLIQQKLIGLKTPILLRGAISEGAFYRLCDKDTDTNILFGPCLNEAYLLQEEIAIYPRIIMSDSLFNSEKIKIAGEELRLLNTFSRKSEGSYWFIDYLKFRMIFLKEGSNGKYGIKQFIESQLLVQQTERIRHKYIWLKDYYNDTLDSGKGVLDEYRILLS